MDIQQFRYGEDNLAYLICAKTAALAVDPGATDEILSFLDRFGLKLEYVINTHTHADHTVGNAAVLDVTGADYISPADLRKQKYLELAGNRIDIFHTPGHSEDALVFHFGNTLVTGDTLLTGKAGRCFTGDLKRFFTSIKLIMAFPDDTIIYGGHDYVLEYMATAKKIEPANTAIDAFAAQYDPTRVCSTLADEYQINPTLRFNTDSIIDVLKQSGLPVETELDRWQSIMSIV